MDHDQIIRQHALVLGEEAKVDSSAGENQKQAQVYLFPKRKQAQKEVSSKAA
jgi:hypothetical protein